MLFLRTRRVQVVIDAGMGPRRFSARARVMHHSPVVIQRRRRRRVTAMRTMVCLLLLLLIKSSAALLLLSVPFRCFSAIFAVPLDYNFLHPQILRPTNATEGALCCFGGFFFAVEFGVTRASDPPVPCAA